MEILVSNFRREKEELVDFFWKKGEKSRLKERKRGRKKKGRKEEGCSVPSFFSYLFFLHFGCQGWRIM